MLEIFITAILFILPASLANAAASVSGKLKPFSNWNYPLDFNKKFKGKRIFGSHKTVRGVLVGIIVAMLVGYVEFLLFQKKPNGYLYVFETLNSSLFFSFLLGLGALIGDAVESFFKRQKNIPPGKPWLPYDWVDYIIGAILITYPILPLPFLIYFILFIIMPIVSVISNIISGVLKIKKGYI